MKTIEKIQNIAGKLSETNYLLKDVKIYNLIIRIPIVIIHELLHILFLNLLGRKVEDINWGIDNNYKFEVSLFFDINNISFWRYFLILSAPIILPVSLLLLTIFFYSHILLIILIIVLTCKSSYPSSGDLIRIKYWNRMDDYMDEQMNEIEMPEDLK